MRYWALMAVTSVVGVVLSYMYDGNFLGEPAPNLVLTKEVLNFSDVIPRQPVTRNLEIRNEGNAPLVIKSIKTGCGCTKSWLTPSNIIKPGNSCLLHVSLEITDLTDNPRKITNVFLESNDPSEPVIQVPILISPQNIKPFQASLIDFGQLDMTRLPVTRKLVGKDGVSPPESVELLYGSKGVAALESGIGKTRKVMVNVQKSMRPGDFYSVFIVGDPSAKTAQEVVVRGHVLGEMFVLPQTLVFNQSEVISTLVSKKFHIHSRSIDANSDSVNGDSCEILVKGPIAQYLSVKHETGNKFIVTVDFARVASERSTRREVGEIILGFQTGEDYSTVGVPVIVELKEARYIQKP